MTLLHCYSPTKSPTGKTLNEAEVRLSIVDPIVKGITRCMNTVVAAKVRVSSSDNSSGTSTSQSNLSTTPDQQRSLSRNIIPDYTFYSLAYSDNQTPVCGIAEVKKRAHFDDNTVCQTIGYYIAGRATTATRYVQQLTSTEQPLRHTCTYSVSLICIIILLP